jgi:hypothetical protein
MRHYIAIIVRHLNCFHHNNTIAVLYSWAVLLYFKDVRAVRDSEVVLVELRICRVIVDARHLIIAVVVRDDEDEAEVAIRVHRLEVEMSTSVDSNHEAVCAKQHLILISRYESLVAIVREDAKDKRRLVSRGHLAE